MGVIKCSDTAVGWLNYAKVVANSVRLKARYEIIEATKTKRCAHGRTRVYVIQRREVRYSE